MFRSAILKKAIKVLPYQYYPENHQILDLLQWSRKENECRNFCFVTLREFSRWKRTRMRTLDRSLGVYVQVEIVLRRRQARNAFMLYRLVKKQRQRLFQTYMEKLPSYKSVARVAS